MAFKRCPHCNQNIKEDAKFCGYCGKLLDKVKTVEGFKSDSKKLDEIKKRNANWFINRVKRYPIIIFTCIFLFLKSVIGTSLLYFHDQESFIETMEISFWGCILLSLVTYTLLWLLITWVASKFSSEKLKQKFYKHPIATITLSLLYLIGLPYQLSIYSSGSGLWKITSYFETIAYFAFVQVLWWLLVCKISRAIFKKQRYQWIWYKKIINNAFQIIPWLYKTVLYLLVIGCTLIIILAVIFNIFEFLAPSAKDLQKLGF